MLIFEHAQLLLHLFQLLLLLLKHDVLGRSTYLSVFNTGHNSLFLVRRMTLLLLLLKQHLLLLLLGTATTLSHVLGRHTLEAINLLELSRALRLLFVGLPQHGGVSNSLLRILLQLSIRLWMLLLVIANIRLPPLMVPFLLREEVFGIVFDKMRVHLRIVGYFSLPLRLLLLIYFICSVHYLLMILHRALI